VTENRSLPSDWLTVDCQGCPVGGILIDKFLVQYVLQLLCTEVLIVGFHEEGALAAAFDAPDVLRLLVEQELEVFALLCL